VVLLTALGTACASSTSPGPSPSPSASPPSVLELKLAVLDALGGRLAYCDPDQFPIAHGSALDAAKARLPMIEANRPAFEAILRHLDLSATTKFTDQQLVTINDLYKQMQVINLTPTGDGYRFDVLVPESSSAPGNEHVIGTVSPTGTVTIERREPGQPINCPICLVAGVRIATPDGDIPVQDLRVGMRVWTTDRNGNRIIGTVMKTGHMAAPIGHEVVRLQFADGRIVVASPGHPTADGRTVGQMKVGDRLDGSTVVAVTLLPYTGFTYDLLPSGPTGSYFADGVLLASTLR
jgi:hypothetical protein